MRKIFLLILIFISVQSFGQNVLYAERLNLNGTTDQFFQKPFTDSVFNIGGTFVQFTVEHFRGMFQPVFPNQFGNYHKDADGIYRNFVPRSQTTDSLTYATKANRDKLKDSLQANINLKQNILGTTAATSATTGVMTVVMDTRIKTITPTGACTFNASGGTIGQMVTFIITTSGVSSFTLTFGTNFRKTGTLVTGTTSARFFAVTFLCIDGTIWQEVSRTIVQS